MDGDTGVQTPADFWKWGEDVFGKNFAVTEMKVMLPIYLTALFRWYLSFLRGFRSSCRF